MRKLPSGLGSVEDQVSDTMVWKFLVFSRVGRPTNLGSRPGTLFWPLMDAMFSRFRTCTMNSVHTLGVRGSVFGIGEIRSFTITTSSSDVASLTQPDDVDPIRMSGDISRGPAFWAAGPTFNASTKSQLRSKRLSTR
jgi:hypothetical protein